MRIKKQAIRMRILALLKQAGDLAVNVSAQICDEFKLSTSQVTRYLKQLELDNLIASAGYGKGKKYRLLKDSIPSQFTCTLNELTVRGEDEIYSQFIRSRIDHYPPNIIEIARHCATELINNVIDHSKAEHLRIALEAYDDIVLTIYDDGIGVFKSLQDYFKLDSIYDAIGELAKGKRTTDKKRHAGKGIFFCQRMCDHFIVRANTVEYQFDSSCNDWSMQAHEGKLGSEIIALIKKTTTKTPQEVFAKYTDENFQFSKSDSFLVKPYTLALKGSLISRSEAKKVLAGSTNFEEIIIDFKEVERIGQGFADEVFRVFTENHSSIKIQYKNANQSVNMMIMHVTRQKNES